MKIFIIAQITIKSVVFWSKVCRGVHVCMCVYSIKMPSTKLFLIYWKDVSKAKTVHFQTGIMLWNSLHSKLLNQSQRFEKFHIVIKLLTWFVRFHTMSLKACITHPTNLTHDLCRLLGMPHFKGVRASLHSLPFNYWLQVFLVFFLQKTRYNIQTLSGQTCICSQWYQKNS